jgi:hypothetical protein
MSSAAFHSETSVLPLPKLRFGELGHGNPKHAYKRLMGEYLISHFGSAGRWWATYSNPKPPSLAELKDQLKASGVSFTEADAKDAHLKLATQFLTERSKTMEEAKSKMFGRILTSLSDEGNELVRSDHRFDEAYAKSNLTVLYRIVMAVHGAGDSNDLRYAGKRARERYIRPIPSSIFLKDKKDGSGKVVKTKARLVAGGHRQPRGDADNTSPTVSTEAVMLVLALAAASNLYV